MDIHFCDLCNESVPQSDLDKGQAFMRKGRIICATCENLMSQLEDEGEQGASLAAVTGVAPPPLPQTGAAAGAEAPASPVSAASPPPPPTAAAAVHPSELGRVQPRASQGGVLAGFLAMGSMLMMAGLTVMLRADDKDVRDLVDRKITALDNKLGTEVQRLNGELSGQRGSFVAGVSDIQRAIDALEFKLQDAQSAQQASLELIRSQLDALSQKVLLLQGFDARVRANESALSGVGPTIAGLGDGVRLLEEAVLELENRMAGVRIGGAAGRDASMDEPSGPPPWFALTEDLKSPNPGIRWQAVQALGETRDEGVVKHLVPMLADDDIFVRMAAARILGELGSAQSIPALIGGLNDSEPSVREAAVVALRKLSGKNFKFDPTASESDRARRVKAWRDWWEKAEEDILGTPAG